jgi:ATP-dependent phosphoenolpyruvate carboxykinase
LGTVIASSGALCSYSGKKTGRSPNDKRIVEEEQSGKDIWVRVLFFLHCCQFALNYFC